jgi:hypothetical protein
LVLKRDACSFPAIVTVVITPVIISLDGLGSDLLKSVSLGLVGKITDILFLAPVLMEPAELVRDLRAGGRAFSVEGRSIVENAARTRPGFGAIDSILVG